MSKHIRFTDTGIMDNNGEGWERPMPVAFQIWTLTGGWRPVCSKHKLLFLNRGRYYRDHAHCQGDYREYPTKDSYLFTVPNYKRVWL